jgi:hypothetical protein
MRQVVARVHRRYARRVADGAAGGRPVVICLTIRRCHAWVSIHLPSTNSLALQFKGTLSCKIKARANSSRKPG